VNGGRAGWDRYERAEVDLGPLLGTPGVQVEAPYEQVARRGFFLLAAEPLPEDPAAISARLAGAPGSGALAAVHGTRRTAVRRTATGTHERFAQLLRGARVVGSDVDLHEDERGVYGVTGRPLGDLAARDPGARPALDPREVLRACAEHFALDELRAEAPEPVVFPLGEGGAWAYEVRFRVPEDAADVRAFLRAEDLSLLLASNVASTATGRARVYPVDPLTTPELVDAELPGLEEPGRILRGRSLDVVAATGGRVVRPDGDFTADPGEAAFDEPQVYFHAWRALEYFRALTDPPLLAAAPFAPMRVVVRDPGSPDNAYYSPDSGDLHFGLFDGRRSSARDASVVVHELGHAVTDAICRLGRSFSRNTEARGLSEGFSDYFAASLLDDPRLGPFIADDPDGARNASDPGLRFPPGYRGEEHDLGAVWAAVLWGLRGRAGQQVTDRLVVESLDFLGPASTFEEARTALHTVDDRLFGGSHGEAIDAEFDARAPAT
jgi:hypothetical protein